ncbi:MAG: SDR family NAD(P)-dependent oxidoreductase, partial [Verrucomicrobiota bacterium]
MRPLTDQVAVVTGAGAGIGAGIADVLSSEGARVAVFDVDLDAANRTASALQAQGRLALALAADVSDSGSLVSAVSQ